MTTDDPASTAPIIVYDGVCRMCNRSLQFILARARPKQFIYIPFQSAQGEAICAHFDIVFDESTSVLLISDSQLFSKTRAWQQILQQLSFRYRVLAFLMRIIPGFIGDRIYDFIGRNRYRWFGRTPSCCLVEPSVLPPVDSLQKRLEPIANKQVL